MYAERVVVKIEMFKRWLLFAGLTLIAGTSWLHVYRTSADARWDFPAFYVAAHTPLAELYDYRSFEARGRSLLSRDGVSYYPPYVRPAVFAIPLRILKPFPYHSAFLLWAALQVVFLLFSGLLIWRIFPSLPIVWLFPLLAFFPAFYGIIFGQDSAGMLLVLSAALYCLVTQRPGIGGVLLGVGLYKFNLILLLPVYLILARQWRAVTGFAVTAFAIGALSAFLAPAGDYVRLLEHVPEVALGSVSRNMIGIRGLAATLEIPWLYLLGVAAVAPVALVVAVRSGMRTGFSIALAGSMLCGYHINGYDGTLAAIPLVALMARTEDMGVRILLAAAVFWISRPPMWLSPLILIAIFIGLIAFRERASSGPFS